MKKQTPFLLTEEDRRIIKTIAAELDTTMTGAVLKAVYEYYKQLKKGGNG